jgi:ketosteroid isomerase-like protein
MSTSASQIVTEFLQAFMSGDIDKASRMVREDFSFRAPLHEGRGNKAAYFAGAESKTKFVRAFRILRQWVDDDEVSTIYELDIETPEGAASMAMSEWHTVEAGQLVSTFMVFNASAKAARLLASALGARHSEGRGLPLPLFRVRG